MANNYKLVLYTGHHCPACGPFTEIVAKIVAELSLVLEVLDIEHGNPYQVSVRSVPTLVVLRNGNVWKTQGGAYSEAKTKKWIEEALED